MSAALPVEQLSEVGRRVWRPLLMAGVYCAAICGLGLLRAIWLLFQHKSQIDRGARRPLRMTVGDRLPKLGLSLVRRTLSQMSSPFLKPYGRDGVKRPYRDPV
ncbi:MAG: hypothetical protein ACRDZO_18740 [Egibacteraceae bacterium]